VTESPPPVELDRALSRLFHESWRERKATVEQLVDELSRADVTPATKRTIIGRLLDGVTEQEAVHGRAACQEVLLKLGRASVAMIVQRIEAGVCGARLLVDLLGQVGSAGEVPLLVRIVSDNSTDPNLRAAAATALGGLGGHQAERALLALLSDPLVMLQVYALDALSVLGARVPVAALEQLVAQPLTRKGATALLGGSGSIDALPLLVPLLAAEMRGVRATAAVSITRLHDELVPAGRAALVRAALTQISDTARERVRELVDHADRDVRASAIRICGVVLDSDVVPQLLGAMGDAALQDLALSVVGQLGSEANPALVRTLDQADTGSREHLYRLIGASKAEVIHPKLLTALVEGLDEPDEDTACAAALALQAHGGRSSVGALYRAMAVDGPLGEAAADALGEVLMRLGGRADDLTIVVGANWPHHGALARNLCRVVVKLSSQEHVWPLVSLLGSSDVGVRLAASHALGLIPGEHEGPSALHFALADEEPHVRAAACRSLGLLKAARSCQPLLTATTDANPLVRAAAVQALVAIDNPIALARLREIIVEDPSPSVVVHAIEGLGSSGLNEDLTMLMSLCRSQDPEVQKAAARALVRFRAHRATAALLGLLDHERWDVRWAAAEVLGLRGDVTALDSVRRALAQESDELVKQVITEAAEQLAKLAETGRSA